MAKKNENLPLLQLIPTTDHDKKVKMEKQEMFCYSKKQLKNLYPEKNYNVVGETRASNKKEAVARLRAGKKTLMVSEERTFDRLFNKCVGYARVAQDDYVALYESRAPFLILLFLLLLGLLLAGGLLMQGISNPDNPVVINPDHPLPDVDTNSTQMEDDDSQKADVEDGGGSVSMIYTLSADVSLSTGDVNIYFKNPNASSHDVSIELYIVSGEDEYLVAESGLIKAGYALDTLSLDKNGPELSEGIYTGLYRLRCYDPVSGEMALVAPEITGVEITVTQ